MSRPLFDKGDVLALEAYARALRAKTAFAPPASNLIVGGVNIPIQTTNNPPPRALKDDELRANYRPRSGKIELECGGVTFPNTLAALDHIVGVLGHEALHGLQASSFSPALIAQAEELAKAARRSADDYAAYLGCEVELPAHAVMIALELRRLDPADFNAHAKTTAIYAYFVGKLTGASAANRLLADLIAEARAMHARFAPVP